MHRTTTLAQSSQVEQQAGQNKIREHSSSPKSPSKLNLPKVIEKPEIDDQAFSSEKNSNLPKLLIHPAVSGLFGALGPFFNKQIGFGEYSQTTMLRSWTSRLESS